MNAKLPRLELGRSGLQVSPLCFGGKVFGWTIDEATGFSLLATKVGKPMGPDKKGLCPTYIRSARLDQASA